MQGRIKRGGGAGNPADRGPAGHQQPSPTTPPSSDSGPRTGPQAQPRPQKADESKGRIGRIAPARVSGLRRYALSNWRIRTRLTALLVLPVIAALVLGGLRIQTSLNAQQDLSKVSKLGELANSAVALADALETERDTMAANIKNGDDQVQSVHEAQSDTMRKKTKFSNATLQLDLTQLPGRGVDVTNINAALNSMESVRRQAFSDSAAGSIQRSVAAYDSLIQPLLGLSQDLALASANQELIQSTRALQAFAQWKENYSIVRAVIAASLEQGKNPFIASDVAYAKSALEAVARNKSEFQALYGAQKSAFLIGSWQQNTNVVATERYMQTWLQNQAPDAGFTAADWSTGVSQSQMTLMASSENILVNELNSNVQALSSQARTDAIVNAALIALVLVVAVAGAALVARSMVRTLAKLQDTAEDVADHRLPDLVRRLSESDPQDVDVSIMPIGIDTTDEIGHVARAFDKVHSQAVRLAAEQALLRGNINAMFTNLSRRSQGLIQRQLSMISELESREADPDQLAQLFKLDHLATRMRRNGENLLVLAGEDPGRRWTRPVPLVDVLRAAASEVEQYERIELASVPTADVAGRVVNDLVHLLAELLENATSFSSPQTRVRVTGHALPDGRVLIEIHDTGIGLSPDDLAEINERLANPPVVDVSVSRRMGLFVVGRLSLRHGIRIQLRPSDSGGTTALVMLPVDVTNVAERRAGGPQRPAAPQGAPRPGAVAPGAGPRPSLPAQPGGQQSPAPAQFGADAPRPGDTFGGGRPGALPQRGAQPGLPQGGTDAPFGAPQQPAPTAQFGAEAPRPGDTFGGGQPGALPQRGAQPGGPTGQFGTDTFGGQQGALPQRGGADAPFGAPQQPAPTGQFGADAPRPGDTFGGGQPGGLPQRGAQPGGPTGQFGADAPRPGDTFGGGPAGALPQGGGDGPRPGDTFGGQPGGLPQRGAQQPGAAGQFGGQPQQPAPGGQFEAPRPGDTFGGQPGGLPQGSTDAPFGNNAPRPAAPQGWAGADAPQHSAGDTGQFARPHFEEEPPAPPAPRVADPLTDPLPRAALPAPGAGAPSGSPIFEQMESNWFRAGRADRMRAVQVYGRDDASGQQAGQPQGQPQPGQPQGGPQGFPAGSTAAGAQPDATPWRASTNDETWRRAEQVREPSAGGVMPSGLPRRVPQANLVPGQAEADVTAVPGPQVSRSPEEVRGRLTNLRRGIQQGRQAGANPNHGTDPQER